MAGVRVVLWDQAQKPVGNFPDVEMREAPPA